MAEQVELTVAPREIMGKATNKRLRKAGVIPANIAGHKEASQAIQVEALLFDRLQRAHAANNIITLRLPDNTTQTALIRHVQRGPRSGKIVHIDFSRVSLYEHITVNIPLHFVGEAPGVKVEGGVLLPLLEAIEVECLASDMVDAIEVDISGLAELNSMLLASDVKLPANYTLVTPADESIVKIQAPRALVAEEAAEEAAEVPAAEATEESGQNT